jgi:hypothetical protein
MFFLRSHIHYNPILNFVKCFSTFPSPLVGEGRERGNHVSQLISWIHPERIHHERIKLIR